MAYPALSAGLSPIDAGLLRMNSLAVGLIWQFALAMIILHREEGNIKLSTISRRFWLNHPVSPRTGETRKSLWWWIPPLILLVGFLEIGFCPALIKLWTAILPSWRRTKGLRYVCDVCARIARPVGWSLARAWIVLCARTFQYLPGREFFFRGVLLPEMEGVFGKWDCVANAVLFGFYHLHQPWGILDAVVYLHQ